MREKLGYREAAKQFEIPDHHSVAKWERSYFLDGPEGFTIERRGCGRKCRPTKFPKDLEEALLKEIQQLRAENTYIKNSKPWFWKKSDVKAKNKDDPGTEAGT